MNTLYKERFPKATQQVKRVDLSYYGFGVNITSVQMEERLRNFIRDHEHAEKLVAEAGEEGGGVLPQDSIAIVRFVHHQVKTFHLLPEVSNIMFSNQVLEMARDCLTKSQERLVTSRYFSVAGHTGGSWSSFTSTLHSSLPWHLLVNKMEVASSLEQLVSKSPLAIGLQTDTENLP